MPFKMETEEFLKSNVQVHAVSCPDIDAVSQDLQDSPTVFLWENVV